VSFTIPNFLNTICKLDKESSSKDPKDSKVFLNDYMKKKEESFKKELNDVYTDFTRWLVEIESIITSVALLNNPEKIKNVFKMRTKSIMRGIMLAN
jgi:WASH complex subunit 7, N-terminal